MALGSYTKTIELKAVVDKSTIQEAEHAFDRLKFKDLFDDEQLKKLKETYIDVAKKEEEIEELEKAIREYRKIGASDAVKTLEAEKDRLQLELDRTSGENGEDWKEDNAILSNIEDNLKKLDKPFGSIINSFSEKFTDTIESATEKIGSSIKSFCSDIISSVKDELTTLSQLMGINTTSVDISAQQEMLQYGLSSQDYYAITQAMEDMGLSGGVSDLIDDMYYMSDEQVERLLEKVDYYGETYGNADVEMLEDYNEFQETWQDFKQGLTDTLIKFLSENKGTLNTLFDLLINLCNTLFDFVSDIMPLLNGIMTILNTILKGLNWLLSGGSTTTTANSDILSARSVYNNSDTDNTITINNNFSGNQTQTEYSNIGQDVANQVIAALQ